MVHEDANIPLVVKSLQLETPGSYSIFFERPRNFVFLPGDWLEISFPGKQLSGGTVYSVSSSPHEPDLRITFRKGISPFKKALAAVQAGDILNIDEFGNDNNFTLNQHRSSILIAGGVGVAPFRSMIRDMSDTGSTDDVQLIYLNTNDRFLFQRDFDAWQDQLTGFSATYVTTKELKRKDRVKLFAGLLPGTGRNYYVSGPTAMVTSTLQILKNHGICMKDIRIDDFGLY